MTNGFVQFTDESGKVVITNGCLSLIKDNSRNIVFYGSRGRSEISDKEFDNILMDIGITIPKIDDENEFYPNYLDDDFTLPTWYRPMNNYEDFEDNVSPIRSYIKEDRFIDKMSEKKMRKHRMQKEHISKPKGFKYNRRKNQKRT